VNTWEKTAHIGAHRAQPAVPALPRPAAAFDKEDVAHV
jgi:hypothetical protein